LEAALIKSWPKFIEVVGPPSMKAHVSVMESPFAVDKASRHEQIYPNQRAQFGKDKNRRKINVNEWRVALPRGLEPLFSP
jgi:hypothetical protein